ncbi:MAG: hypothetical protein ACRDL5_11995 [Solirubrobacteraceae bacterium]
MFKDDTGFHRDVDTLRIAPRDGLGLLFEPADPLRTRCPGPSAQDALGLFGELARGRIAARRLGSRTLTITLANDGPLSGSAYFGRRGGALRLTLLLVREQGGTQVVHPRNRPGS